MLLSNTSEILETIEGSETSILNQIETSTEIISGKINDTISGNIENQLAQIISMLSLDCNKIEASDNLLLTLLSTEITAGSKQTGSFGVADAGTFHCDLTGTIRIKANLKHPSSNGSSHIALYRDDTIVAQSTSVRNNSTYQIITFDVAVEKGNNYKICLRGAGSAGYSGAGYCDSVEVYGTYTRGSVSYVYQV